MSLRNILISLILAVVLILTSAPAFAGPPGGMFPPPGLHPMMGPAGIIGDKQYLYVLAGPKIMQYTLSDLKLLKTANLPKPAAPKEKEARPCPPPHPPLAGPQGFWLGDKSLFVLAGPQLCRFSIPDLVLRSTVELPRPEPPKTGE